MRILVAECKQEVSTFNPALSHTEDFDRTHGAAILAFHRGGRHEVGGALSVFDMRPDVTLVPTFSARAISSAGTLAAADWHVIADEFLGALRAAGPVDAAYFSLHGAMGAADEGDPEGYLLQEARHPRRAHPYRCLARSARHPHRADAGTHRRAHRLPHLPARGYVRHRRAGGAAPAANHR